MDAVGLSAALFVFWMLLGTAVLGVLGSRRNLLQNLLIGPAVGLSTSLLPSFWLNRAGLPVEVFASVLTAALVVLCAGLLWRQRTPLPSRQFLPFLPIFGLALALTARPMLRFGFDWLSFCNDDMANYCLAAQRFLHHGYGSVPEITQLFGGQEYSLYFWFLHVTGCSRSGAELVLAWIAGVTGLSPDQLFMPVIVALHLTLISAGSALALPHPRPRGPALLAAILMSLSALTSLGALYQLIAQVGGLALLAACVVLLTRADVAKRRPPALFLCSLACAGLLIFYPEVTPFLGLGVILYYVRQFGRGQVRFVPVAAAIVIVVLVALLSVGSYTVSLLSYLWNQVLHGLGVGAKGDYLFPYYLLPSGLATFWGLLPIGPAYPEPWLSLTIGIGAAMFTWAIVAIVREAWHGRAAAALALPMLVLGCVSFAGRSDFALYKLAMYLQPAMLSTLAVRAWGRARRPTWWVTPLVVVSMAGALLAQRSYVDRSSSDQLGGFVEIPHVSRAQVTRHYRHLLDDIPRQRRIASDTYNIVLAKLEALNTRGRELKLLGSNLPFINAFPYATRLQVVMQLPGFQSVLNRVARFAETRALLTHVSEFVRQVYTTCTACNTKDKFRESPLSAGDFDYLIATPPDQTILNRRPLRDSPPGVVGIPVAQVRNHLVFTESLLSRPYYTTTHTDAAMFQIEDDPMMPGRTMAGLGRHMLLRVLKPSPSTRVELEITATLKGDRTNLLPVAAAVGGSTLTPVPFLGRGSARVFSEPVQPQELAGQSYLYIDLGEEGTYFPTQRSGLMQLYGTDVRLDSRVIVAFGRNISAISEEEYAALHPPAVLARFPEDLMQRDLEYSGVYEDGWISEAAFVRLVQPDGRPSLHVAGMVPAIADPEFTTDLRVLVDGEEVTRAALKPGRFDLRTNVPLNPGAHRVELRFSNTQTLPAPDNRPTAAQLYHVGFEAGGQAADGPT